MKNKKDINKSINNDNWVTKCFKVKTRPARIPNKKEVLNDWVALYYYTKAVDIPDEWINKN